MSAAVEAAAEHRQQQPPAPAHPSPAPRSPAPPTPLTPPVSASATPPALHAAAPTASAPSSTAPPPPPPPPLPPTRRNSRHPDRHLESSQPSSSATTSATASPASTSTSTGTGASLSLEELARAPLSPLVPCLAHSSPPPLQHAASAQGSTRREPTANRGPLSPMQPSRQSVQWESPVMYPVEASLSEEEDTSLEVRELTFGKGLPARMNPRASTGGAHNLFRPPSLPRRRRRRIHRTASGIPTTPCRPPRPPPPPPS
jgi:hypothetical protein